LEIRTIHISGKQPRSQSLKSVITTVHTFAELMMIRSRVHLNNIARRCAGASRGGSLLSVRFATSVGSSRPLFSMAQINLKKPSYEKYAKIVFSDKSDGKPEESNPEKTNDPTDTENEVPEKTPEETPETDKDIETEIDKETSTEVIAKSSEGLDSNASSAAPPSDNNNNDDDDHSNKPQTPVNPNTGLYPPLLAIYMKDRPPLPGRGFVINVTDPDVIESVYTIIDKREPYFVLFHAKDQDAENTDIIKSKDSVYDIGVHCQIIRHTTPSPGLFSVFAYPLERCQLEDLSTPGEKKEGDEAGQPRNESTDFPTSYLKDFNVSYATVKPVKDEPFDNNSTEITALVESIKVYLGKLGNNSPLQKLKVKDSSELLNDPSRFADFIGSTTHGDPKQIQEILGSLDVQARLAKALELLKVEVNASLVKESTIHKLTAKVDENQTRQFLKEFIKELQKRAGLDSEDKRKNRFEERVKHLKMTAEAKEAYETELAKFITQSDNSSETGISEKYLDWLTSIPWGIYSKDRFNVKLAREVLDRDHYGLKEVKERILEFISMGRISGKVDGKIICLAGPPGTGKTSIAKSIAEALDRKYVRIAMGGVQDVHEVKGHRRTYVGSVPGRIVYALKQAKTSNPLMLIDEIDKLDLSRSGGAASAFLEILDPEQNNAFVDNYIDVKVDLSKVLFVCTANYLGNIPPPLRDRMEIIDVSGYTNKEKIEIAKKHLIPNASKKAGLSEGTVVIATETISRLIDKYCRESGLRNIKKLINRIFSKASLKIVEQIDELELQKEKEAESKKVVASSEAAIESTVAEPTSEAKLTTESEVASVESAVKKDSETTKETTEKQEESENQETEVETYFGELAKLEIPSDIKIEITSANLKEYVGPEIYTRDRVYDILPPGVATGLAYSSSGNGDALYIESILTHSIGSGSGHASMHVTGSLKDVMKESASIAYSFAKLFMVKNYAANRFFESAEIHVNCPDGAVPKDGPSAGICFTTSLMSLALNQSVPPTFAMTGEITVTGRVLAVGGLREKVLGAKRYGCDTIIFPKDIENELEDIPEEVKEGVKFIPVEWYHEVFDVVFPDMTPETASEVWKDEFTRLDQRNKGKKK
jgi:Lon-like ATP-dependent protease